MATQVMQRTTLKERNGLITAEELWRMGDIGRCELVRGEIIRMSPPGGEHGDIAAEIGSLLRNHVKVYRLGKVAAAETGFIISRNPDTVRAPDAAFVSKERVPPEGVPKKYWPFAPDLAVEVMSPDDRWKKVKEKVQEWLNAGTRMVWVVNPKRRTVHVFRPKQPERVLTEEDTLSGEDVVLGFEVKVEELFSE
jgi:Uma2 family endonuclease